MRAASLVAVALGCALVGTSASACGLIQTVWPELAWLPDGSALVYLTEAGVVRFDVASGEATVISGPEDDYGPQRFALSPDGTTVVHASVRGVGAACHGAGPTLRFTRLSDGMTLRRWTRWRGYFGPVLYHPDGGLLIGFEDWPFGASPSDEEWVVRRTWRHGGRGWRRESAPFVSEGAFSPDGDRLLAWRESTLRILDARTWVPLAERILSSEWAWVERAVWTPTGRRVLSIEYREPTPAELEAHDHYARTAQPRRLMLLDGQTLARRGTLDEHDWWPTGAAVSSDERWLAVVRQPTTGIERWRRSRLEIRDPTSLELLAIAPVAGAILAPVAWSPDDGRVAVGGFSRCSEPERCGHEIGAPEIFTLEELGLAGEESDPS